MIAEKNRIGILRMSSEEYGIIERLYATLEARKGADPKDSYVASLYAKGVDKIAGKIAEESAETICEAVRGDRAKIASESADLIFHLMVLWAYAGVRPQDVFGVLEDRFGTGGHEEKDRRNTG